MKHLKKTLALMLAVSVTGTCITSFALGETEGEDASSPAASGAEAVEIRGEIDTGEESAQAIDESEAKTDEAMVEAPEEGSIEVINEVAAEISEPEKYSGIMPMSSVQAPGYQTDPDTGEDTIDENGYVVNTYGYSMHQDPFNTKQVMEGKEYSSGNKHLHDPYWLKDENFFGKWNAQTGSWSIKGKLNYEKYSGLADVETCVKDGDYETARLMLYNYYIRVERERNRKKNISTDKADRITADLLLKNFMYNARSGITPLEMLNIGNTNKYYSADITDTVSKYIGTRQSLTFWVIATDKNGDSAVFDSKEAGENVAPYLLMKVNGTERIVYPSDDMNIKAGSNAGKTFGSEPVLTAHEDAINAESTLVNENTSRIYIKFDVSWLKSGDTVSAATLNLHGHNEKADEEKELVVFYSDDSDWNEKTSNYNNVLAQVIFSYDQLDSWEWDQPTGAGFRYQEELLRFDTWYDKLVKLYNFTGEEKYAYTALRLLTDYIYVRGNDICWLKSLDVAVRSQCLPVYTMQLIESDYMTPDVFTSFLKYMYVEANGAQYFTRTGNWGTSECQGLYTIAATFPEFTDSDQWVNRVKTRYESLSNDMIMSDMVCTELALGYVDYSITTLTGAKDVADELGVTNLPYTEKTLENIRNLGLFEYYSSMPGIRDNQVGDANSHRGTFKTRMQYLARWFNHPHLNYAAGYGGEEPDFTSILFPVGLKAVMRTGWDDNAWYLYTDADGGYGNHSHPDDNSIVIMADGQYLLVDPLYGSYSGSNAVTWLTSTIAHNTVTMNGKSQYNNSSSGGKGNMERWETNNTYDFLTSNTPNTPDASTYKRTTLFLRNKFWLVNDYLVPNNSSSNKYVQAWHFLPEANIEIDPETSTTSTNNPGVNIQVVPVAPEEYTSSSIKSGYYSEGQGSVSPAEYTEYEKNETGNTIFNTLLLPVGIGDEYEATVVGIDIAGMEKTDASAYEIYLQNKKNNSTEHYIYYLLHNTAKKGTVALKGYTTDASMMFLEVDEFGSPSQIIVQDASFINQGRSTVYKSDNPLEEISVTFNGQICTIDSSVITAERLKENNLQISTGESRIGETTLNGEKVGFTQSGEYLYMGTAPTGDPEATASPAPKSSATPMHGVGGSGGGGGGGGVGGSAPKPTATPDVSPAETKMPAQTAAPSDSYISGKVMNPAMVKELENHWARSEVEELYQLGIVSGISDTSLGLDESITRAQFAALIVRALGLESESYSGSFADVDAGAWYADIIQTAYNHNLVSGSDNMMMPENKITREEMAVILKNAAVRYDSIKTDIEFTDSAEISVWAKDSVDNAVSLGLMEGMGDGSFAPKNTAKRSEAFVVIYRLIKLME